VVDAAAVAAGLMMDREEDGAKAKAPAATEARRAMVSFIITLFSLLNAMDLGNNDNVLWLVGLVGC